MNAKRAIDFPQRFYLALRGKIRTRLGLDPITGRQIAARDDVATLGTQYGGWAIPLALFDERSKCYCVGCGEDISFDLALIDKFKCVVYGYDPTPRSAIYVNRVAAGNEKYVFSPIGLWNKSEMMRFYAPQNTEHVSHSVVNLQHTNSFFEAPVAPLSSLMERNGHLSVDLLKIDIEGAEYVVIDDIMKLPLIKLPRVICVDYDEFNWPQDNKWRSRVFCSINSVVDKGYRIVAIAGRSNYTFCRA